MFVVD